MARSIILAVDVDTDPGRIVDILTTTDGLASFWTPQVGGDPDQGGDLHFGFAEAPADLQIGVTTVDPDGGRVEWACQGPWPHWGNTTIEWSIVAGEPLRLLFAHRGWDEGQPERDFGSVAYTWALVLGALKAYAESGVPAPALG